MVKKAKTERFTVRLTADLKVKLEAKLLQRKGISLNQFIISLIEDCLNDTDKQQTEVAILKTMQRIERQNKGFARTQEVIAEMIAVYVKNYLINVPQQPESQRDIANAQGKVRFDQYIALVAKKLNYDGTFFNSLPEKIFGAEDFTTEDNAGIREAGEVS